MENQKEMTIEKVKKNAERRDKIVEIFERKKKTNKPQDIECDKLEKSIEKHPEDVPMLPLLKTKEDNVDQPQDLATHPPPQILTLNKQETCTSGDSDIDVDDAPLQIAEDTEKKVLPRFFYLSNNISIIFMPIPISTLSLINNFHFTVRSIFIFK